ncbi:MAG: DsbA family protein [Nitrospirota bacterium]|nr:DsbA family protein [Nitrospirota bacterium]
MTGFKAILSACAAAVILSACGGGAPSGNGDSGNAEVLAELKALRAELRELSDRLDSLQPGAPSPSAARPDTAQTPVPTAGYPSMGKDSAPVTVVEFSDYRCPFCGRHSREVLPQIVRNFVNTGKVRYVYMDFAVKSYAREAAEAAHCAGEQGQYWEMHDYLFERQGDIRPDNLESMARAAGVPDMTAFKACIDDTRFDTLIATGRRYGQNAGVSGTPTFVVGRSSADGVISGELVIGAKPYEDFADAINAAN